MTGTTIQGWKVEVRECATLGTNFADVYVDGKLFARELSRPVAETFAEYADFYPNAFADEAKLRTWMIEKWDEWVNQHLKEFAKSKEFGKRKRKKKIGP